MTKYSTADFSFSCLQMSMKRSFYVDKRYHVAKYDETLITPTSRPSLLTWRGLKSSVFYYTWRQAVGFILVYYTIQLIYRYNIEDSFLHLNSTMKIWDSTCRAHRHQVSQPSWNMELRSEGGFQGPDILTWILCEHDCQEVVGPSELSSTNDSQDYSVSW